MQVSVPTDLNSDGVSHDQLSRRVDDGNVSGEVVILVTPHEVQYQGRQVLPVQFYDVQGREARNPCEDFLPCS